MGAQLFGCALLFVFGIIFSLAGINSMFMRWQKRSWIKVPAVIISIDTKLIYDEGYYTADTVAYEYGSNQFQGEVETSVNKHKLGQSLRLRYNPNEPSTHELTFRGEWLGYLLFELGGFAMLFFAYLLWLDLKIHLNL